MALFLQRNNNLADVENINEVQKNLGIGSMAFFNSNQVNITGGTISIDNFSLKSSNAKKGRFLMCQNSNGLIDFSDVDLGTWIHRDINNIRISEFDHSDFVFLNKDSLCNVAFTGDYNDIIYNKPNFYSDLSNDVDFLYNDLRNIDVVKARCNLGIGSMALKNSNDAIFFEELHITSNLLFTNENFTNDVSNHSDKFFYIDNNGKGYWNTLPIASENQYGVVRVIDNYNNPDHSNYVPSMTAFNDMHNYFQNLVTDLEVGDVSSSLNVINTINHNGILQKENNLRDLTNMVHARSNLGFNSNMEKLIDQLNNSNSFCIDKLIINSNIIFEIGDSDFRLNDINTELIENATYLAVNSDGNVTPKNFPFATTSTPGFVYILDNYDYTKFTVTSQSKSTVLSARAFDQFVQGVYMPLYNSISNSIEPRIRELFGNYLHISDNLLVENPSVARQNLQLHEIAYTGDFFQLNNRPSNLSFFNNDSQFLIAKSNLADLTNVMDARSNLGIGSLASYDSNDVFFIRGNGTFSNLHVSNNFRYKYDDHDHTSHFLRCLNKYGECKWEPLPEATHTQKGIVQLESDYTKFTDRAASSGAAIYTMYHRIMGEIDILQREVNDIQKMVELFIN